MITFFQKHKNSTKVIYFLVVIAFISSGFLGVLGIGQKTPTTIIENCGEYSYNYIDLKKESDRILEAKFQFLDKKEKITKISEYSKKFPKKLEQEALKQLTIKCQTLDFVSNKLFLSVSNENIIKELERYTEFKKEGFFDLNTYKNMLKKYSLSIVDFEKKIKENFLIQKYSILLKDNIISTDNDLDEMKFHSSLAKETFFRIHKINEKRLNSMKVSDKDIINYWKDNKQKWKSNKNITISLFKNKGNSTKDYLSQYVEFKKSKKNYITTKTIDKNSKLFKKLDFPTVGRYYKPFIIKNEVYLVKVLSISEPKIKDLKEVKELITRILKTEVYKEQYSEILSIKENALNYLGEINEFSAISNKFKNAIDNDKVSKLAFAKIKKSFKLKESFIIDNYLISLKVTKITNSDLSKKDLSVNKQIVDLYKQNDFNDFLIFSKQ